MKFCVYELRGPDGVPFYIGKGCRARCLHHRRFAANGMSGHRYEKIRKLWSDGLDYTEAIVFETDSESDANSEERRLIAHYGRANLTNKTDGGDGVTNPTAEVREKIAAGRRGCVASDITRLKQRHAKLGTHRSAETKAKISASQRGATKPWARIQALKNLKRMVLVGRKHTPAAIEKMRAAKMGHVVSAETRAKISASKQGQIPWNKKIKT